MKKTAREEKEITNGADAEGYQRSGTPYPYYSLKDALDFAAVIRRIGGNEAAEDDVLKALGLESKTTRAWSSRLSSAKEFGLVNRVGRGAGVRLQVTELCKRILMPEGQAEVQAARMQSFLDPPLYRQLTQRYSGAPAPSAEGLANLLVREFGLVEAVGPAAAAAFLDSAKFVGVITSDGHISVSRSAAEKEKGDPTGEKGAPSGSKVTPRSGMQSIEVPADFIVHPFPLRRDFTVQIPLPPDITRADVSRLHKWLATLPLDEADSNAS